MKKHFLATFCLSLILPMALLFAACSQSDSSGNSEATVTGYTVAIGENGVFAAYNQNNILEFSSEDEYLSVISNISKSNDILVTALYSDGTSKRITNWRVQQVVGGYDLNILYNNVIIGTIVVSINDIPQDEVVALPEFVFGGITGADNEYVLAPEQTIRYTGAYIDPLEYVTIREASSNNSVSLREWLTINAGLRVRAAENVIDNDDTNVTRKDANSIGGQDEYSQYYFLIEPATGFTWADGTNYAMTVGWTIERAILTATVDSTYSAMNTKEYVYNGNPQGPTVTISGLKGNDTTDDVVIMFDQQTNVAYDSNGIATYPGVVSLKGDCSNYIFMENDEEVTSLAFPFKIVPASLNVSSVVFSVPQGVAVTYNEDQIPQYTYTGNEIKPDVNVENNELFSVQQNGAIDVNVNDEPYSFTVSLNLIGDSDVYKVATTSIENYTHIAFARNYVWSSGESIDVWYVCQNSDGSENWTSCASWTYQYFIVKADSTLPSNFQASDAALKAVEYNGNSSFTLNVTNSNYSLFTSHSTLNSYDMFANGAHFKVSGADDFGAIELTIGSNDITLLWYAGSEDNYNPVEINTTVTLTPKTIIIPDGEMNFSDNKDGTDQIDSTGNITDANNNYPSPAVRVSRSREFRNSDSFRCTSRTRWTGRRCC